MNLTNKQIEALDRGEHIELAIGDRQCVVMSRNEFDRLTGLQYDDSEWTEEEMMLLASEASDDLDQMDEIRP